MEAFSLLKYWRGGGGGGGGGSGSVGDGCTSLRTKTIVTAVSSPQDSESEDDDGVDGDDGPFFDLEFAVQDENEGDEDDEEEEEDNEDDEDEDEDDKARNGKKNKEKEKEKENDDVETRDNCTDGEEEEEDREFNFTFSSNSSNDRTDSNLALSPSDDLFFKGRLVPIEPSSLELNSAEPNTKPQFPVSLLKSATKFRVFMLGLKKSKHGAGEKTEANCNGSATVADHSPTKPQQKQEAENNKKQSKFLTVKFKVEEVPIVSLFTRENSSRANNKSSVKQSAEELASEEKNFSKDVMQKYLKKVKPLYVRVSKRYSDKLKLSGQLNPGALAPKSVQPQPSAAVQKSNAPKLTAEAEAGETQVKSQKQANIPERLRVVCKHLGKSRSASSAVAAAPAGTVSSRRDDSLLQQQDGIQSAILHCKRSFNASRDSESSLLARSSSDPHHQKSSIDSSKKSAK